MEALGPLVVPVGWVSLLAIAVISVTKIVIVAMVIRGVPVRHRADVLRAAGSLFVSRRARGGREDSNDE